jgi:peroxiredoxin Q/BCP
MRSLALALAPLVLACGREPAPPASATPSSAAPTAAAAAAPGEVAVGKAAPDFAAKAHDGADLKLSALKGKPVVVYFYPKDETPGCTKEACAFRDAWKELSAKGVVLVGVSADSLESHREFAKNHKLPFHLISDADGGLSRAFGVPSFGRQTFVVGADGNVKKIYRSVDVTTHAAEILRDLE